MRALFVLAGIVLSIALTLSFPALLIAIGYFRASVLWLQPLWIIGFAAMVVRYRDNWARMRQSQGMSAELITSTLIPVATTSAFVAVFYGVGVALRAIFNG